MKMMRSSIVWLFTFAYGILSVSAIPAPDGLLHIYALPVGQGDAMVIQCPSGTLTVVDTGTTDGVAQGFWHTNELKAYFQGSYHLIRNILLSHNHQDHYSFFPNVFTASSGLTGLQNIYISCTAADLPAAVSNWVSAIGATSKLRLFRSGQPCGPTGGTCGNLDLCPSNSAVTAKVLTANAGQQCTASGGNKNIDSIVFSVRYGSVKVHMNGDFEDFGSSASENGPQKALVDFYGTELQSTVYVISHHGAENLANKAVIRNAVKPKAIMVSGNPWSSYRHPRCGIIDAFINDVKTLCRPTDTNTASAYYCAAHPVSGISNANKLQSTYTCGEASSGQRAVTNNNLAIFTTVPTQTQMNVVEFRTDGTKWGFVNNFVPRVLKSDMEDDS